MAILYRVEHPLSKKGPYDTVFAAELGEAEEEIIGEMVDYHSEGNERLSIHNDGEWLWAPSGLYCACDSINKLLWWFEGYIDYLLNMGYQILRIQVTEADIIESRSGKQTFFRKDNILSSEVLF